MILVQDEPAGGRELLHAALQNEAGQGSDAVAWQTGRPLPLYRLTANAASKSAPLSRARKVGWRYPLLRGEVYGFACLLIRSKHLVFTGLNEHFFSQTLFEAAELAENSLSSETTKYEPRLLEIPALRMVVLWLFAKGGKSRFIVVKLPHTESAGGLLLEDDIHGHLLDALSHVASKYRPTVEAP